MIVDDLFTFPIIMVDGENEEEKEKERERFGSLPGQTEDPLEYDIVYGEAEYPYFDFRGCEDRWLPTQQSLQRALRKKFDACIVRFEGAGQFLVPWNKSKFKEEISKFAKEREGKDKRTKVKLLELDPKIMEEAIKKANEREDNE